MLQVWLFVAPGLYANEKKLAVPFVFFSSALFLAGAAFSHYLAFPMAFQFFASFQTAQVGSCRASRRCSRCTPGCCWPWA